jgi:PTH2 family peptidyl-tRNA hydrolase
LACYKTLLRKEATSKSSNSILRRWESTGQAKVSLKANSEDELLLLQAQAVSLGLCARIIHDAGRTQIEAGSATVIGIGPGPKSVLDQVTGHLKLL